MAQKRIIETVCSANYGRSVPAELIGRAYLQSRGLDGILDTSSSGSNVNEFFAPVKERSPKAIQFTLGLALKRDDIFKPAEYQLAERILKGDVDPKSPEALKLYQQANEMIKHEEEERREIELRRFGVAGTPKTTHEQTRALPDRIAVLSMAPSNNDIVKKIYANSGYNPVMEVLSAYATRDPKAQLPNAFGAKDPQVYRETMAALVKQVPMAIDRLISERAAELRI